MDNQKLETQLQMALSLPERVRQETMDLNVGYDDADERWTLLIRYVGDILAAESETVQITVLLGGYAVVVLPQEEIEAFSALPQVIYVEKPKRLNFAVYRGKQASCFTAVQAAPYNLTGEGVLIGIVDSGIDIFHPDFRNPDGTTRITALWDQTAVGEPPAGFRRGRLYRREEINTLLETESPENWRDFDSRGHGTAVAGIAAGGGQTDSTYRGAAWKSELLVVRLGAPDERSFPRTSELMTGVDFLVWTAVQMGKAIAVNISFGNNYGSHDGDSLLSSYLDEAAVYGRNVICIGMGNEGAMARHASGQWQEGQRQVTELAVQSFQTSFNLQMYLSYEDQVDFFLVHPDGQRYAAIDDRVGTQEIRLGDTIIYLNYGQPTPYSRKQEVYLEFVPEGSYVDSGTWRIVANPRRIVTGDYDYWLPSGQSVLEGTKFLFPDPDRTFTEPAGTSKAIAVAAYDTATQSYAPFSGRGFPQAPGDIQPVIAAPGVNITTVRAGGGYAAVTGTSFATPFVTGACALLMEWGIVRGNDPYLYGQKLKSYLISGARRLPGVSEYPNRMVGYGALCVRDSLPLK